MSTPGLLRIGGNIDGSNSLSGAVTCLQIVPCKNAIDATVYDPKCNQINWPGKLIPPDSEPTSTETPKTTDASTTTIVAATTTITTKTTSSNTSTTKSDALTTLTSTSGAYTTITSAQATTSMVQTTTTSNTFVVINSCHHYRMTGNDVTFGNHSDIVDVLMVSVAAKCAVECDRIAECNMFAVSSQGIDFECKLGVKTSALMNFTGSKLFEK